MAPAEREPAAPGDDPSAEADPASAEADPAQDVGEAPHAPTPVVRRSKPTPTKAFLGRFMLGHLIAYPIGFVTAVAGMPLAMLVRKRELMEVGARGAQNGIIREAADKLALTATEAAQVEIVLGFCMWATAFALLLVHLWTLPWAMAAGRAVKHPERAAAARKHFKRFKRLTAITFATVAIGGVIGWTWVLTL